MKKVESIGIGLDNPGNGWRWVMIGQPPFAQRSVYVNVDGATGTIQGWRGIKDIYRGFSTWKAAKRWVRKYIARMKRYGYHVESRGITYADGTWRRA